MEACGALDGCCVDLLRCCEAFPWLARRCGKLLARIGERFAEQVKLTSGIKWYGLSSILPDHLVTSYSTVRILTTDAILQLVGVC